MTTTRFMSLFNQATKADEAGQFDRATELYQQAIRESPLIWAFMGNHALRAGQKHQALHHLTQAYEAATEPAVKARCLNDIGHIVQFDDRARAEECFREAIRLDGNFSAALGNLALCLKWRNEIEEALKCVNKAIRLEPREHSFYFTRALIYLLQGELLKGFVEYEERWLNPMARIKKLDIGVPELPSIAHARGAKILVYGEQGAGDTIQMARYGPLLKAAGAKCWLSAQNGLTDLLMLQRCWEDVWEPVRDGEEPEWVVKSTGGLSYIVPMMSLPRLFQTTLETIPPAPYLPIAIERNETTAVVALVWGGSADHNDDRLRSIPVEMFEPLLDLDLSFFSFQQGARAMDLELPGLQRINKFPCGFRDYLDTARTLSSVDLLITVDTSIAHLAGAIGLKTWLLLPFAPDWRWMLERADSPWYPSIRLFRQPKEGDWASVIELVKQELVTLL